MNKSLSFFLIPLLSCAALSAEEYVYVESNIKSPNGNSIFAYKRGAKGDLTAVPGSPFLTGGAGIQDTSVMVGPIDSDQNIVVNPEQTLLFAVNSGSDTIAVFNIHSDGSLTPIEGSPFSSGGNNPVSLGLDGDILVVVNKGGDFGRPSGVLPNYATMRVASDGRLTPVSDKTNASSRGSQSIVSVSAGSSPTQAFVVPGLNLVIGADFLGGLIQRFVYTWDGNLRQMQPLALPASEFSDTTTPRLPLGIWGHPTEPLIYIGFVTVNKIGVYRYGYDETLTFVRAVPASGKAICWFRTNASGSRLYASNTGTNSISVFDLSIADEPRQIQELVLEGVGNVLQFELSRDGHSLYALSSRGSAMIPQGQGNVLHTLDIDGEGMVAENQAPIIYQLPENTRPQGVATATPR